MVVPSGAKRASDATEKARNPAKDAKAIIRKLEGEVAAAKEEWRVVKGELEEVREALVASEASKKKMEEALQKKEEEHSSLQQLVKSKFSGALAMGVEKELNDTQKLVVGTMARKTLWVKYKVINDLSFDSGEIYQKCFQEMNVTGLAEQKPLERSVRLEYCRSLSQHKYHVKNAVMRAWEGKPKGFVLRVVLCVCRPAFVSAG